MAEDQDDQFQQDNPDPNVYQPDQEEDEIEIDRRIRRANERLKRMTMVGFPQFNEEFLCQDSLNVEGGWDTGWAINYIDCGKQLAREGPPPPPITTGACCQFDGSCTDEEEFLCVAPAIFQGIGTTCATTRCEGACAACDPCLSSCTCYDAQTYDECQALIPFLGAVGWLLDGDCITNDCCYFFGSPPCCGSTELGACCALGFCLDDIDEVTCAGFGGTFWQHDITCVNAIACGYTDCGT